MTRPLVTLAYAQSLDGCLAAEPGRPLALSGPEARQLTHTLRAANDAILVGVGTVLADNPRLTVRHAAGPDPQPIVVDSRLRLPLESNLLREPARPVWVAATRDAPIDRVALLTERGARVILCPAEASGRVNLAALLEQLSQAGVRRLMVEGGAQIITAFLAGRLADRLVLTIAPRLVGGVRAVAAPVAAELRNVTQRALGADLIVEADLA